jgi:hypothetical protein
MVCAKTVQRTLEPRYSPSVFDALVCGCEWARSLWYEVVFIN